VLALVRNRFVRPRLTIDPRLSWTLLAASLPFGSLLILHVMQAQLGTFVVSLYRSADAVGIYSAASTLIGVLLLVPTAFSSAIFPAMSRLNALGQSDLRGFYELTYKYLLLIGFPMGLGTILVGDRVIVLVYGDQFEGSAAVVRVLAIFLLTIVGYSNGPLLYAVGRQGFFAWTQALANLANALLCLLLVPAWGPVGAATAFVASGVATFIVHSMAAHHAVGLPLPWLTMSKVLLATAFMGLGVSICLRYGAPWLPVVLVAGPILYGLPLVLLGLVKREDLQMMSGTAGAQPAVRQEVSL
jgi:O-antigen/teichoic acid export membrane protein